MRFQTDSLKARPIDLKPFTVPFVDTFVQLLVPQLHSHLSGGLVHGAVLECVQVVGDFLHVREAHVVDHPGSDRYWISVDKLQGEGGRREGKPDSPNEGKTVLLTVLGLHNTLGELPLYHGHSHQLELRLGDLL